MATIGSMAVNIVAVTDKFNKGIQSAKSILGGFVGDITSASNIIGGIGVAGIAMFVKETVAAVDELGDLAANLTINVEALQALDYATKQLGGSEQALHVGLTKMRQVLGDAARGSDTAVGAFNALGLNYAKLLNLPIEQQFLAIVGALHDVKDSNTQASIAQDIFGKGSKELISVIQSGTEEIVKMSDELARMGGILSKDQVDAMGEAQNSIQSFSQTLAVMKQQVVATYADEIPLAMDLAVGAIQTVRVAFLLAQGSIVTGAELVINSVQGMVDAINILLPKSLEISRQQLDSYAETFAAKRKEIFGHIQDIVNGTGTGPLTPPPVSQVSGTAPTKADAKAALADKKLEEKETAKNTKIVADQLKEMTTLMKQGYTQNEAYVKVAGVR